MIAVAGSVDPSFLEQIAPVATAIGLTALLGAIAAWAGSRWERRHAHEAWLRDNQLSAYLAHAEACNALWVAIRDAAAVSNAPGWTDEERDRRYSVMNDQIAGSGVTNAAIEILGPDEVADAASSLRAAHITKADEARKGPFSQDVVTELGAMEVLFLTAASQHLAEGWRRPKKRRPAGPA